MNNIGLVLEGGGMRGVYTAGVLDFFIERNLYFPYVVGVSAGACTGTSYISKQNGRNKVALIDYVHYPGFFGLRNLMREKSLFGMKLIFEDIPNKFEPFNFECFFKSKQKFIIATTDCETGEAYYIDKDELRRFNSPEDRNDKMLQAVKASSSLPFISPSVQLDGRQLIDGGIADPIPIKKAQEDGMIRNVVILTRDELYKKKRFNYKIISKKFYSDKLNNILVNRFTHYNSTLDYIEQLQIDKKAFVIRPKYPLNINRFERNQYKLHQAYSLGYDDAAESYQELLKWIKNEKVDYCKTEHFNLKKII